MMIDYENIELLGYLHKTVYTRLYIYNKCTHVKLFV